MFFDWIASAFAGDAYTGKAAISSTLQFAEGMNLALFVILTIASIMFAVFTVNSIRLHGWRDDRTVAIFSIDLLVIGEAVLRGWYWWWRVQYNAGQDVVWMDEWPLPQFGMGLEMLGVLLLMRTFQPDAWKRNTWFWVGLFSMVVAAVVTILPR